MKTDLIRTAITFQIDWMTSKKYLWSILGVNETKSWEIWSIVRQFVGHFGPLVTTLISVSNKVNHIAGGKTFWIFNVFKSQERLGIPVEETKCKNRESCQQEIMFVKWEKRRMPFLSYKWDFFSRYFLFLSLFFLFCIQPNQIENVN